MIDFFTRIFRREQPKTLRNRVGGMAWIKGLNSCDGDEILNGRAVRCVRLEVGDFWEIDPPQEYVCTRNTIYPDLGLIVWRGDGIRVKAIKDDCLEPWKDIGDVTDEKLFEAPPKVKELAHA